MKIFLLTLIEIHHVQYEKCYNDISKDCGFNKSSFGLK